LPEANNWRIVDEPAREPAEGEVLVKTLYLSVDPAMRGWMDDKPSYSPPVQIGEVMRALGVGQVVASRHARFAPGDYVSGMPGVQTYACVDGDALGKIDPHLAPLPKYLSVLGMTGMTAYFGLFKVGEAKAGDTVVISAASGAVGSIAGQLAKIAGCRTVGIAGGPQKCAYLRDELGFDAAIDYHSDNMYRALREHCPSGINVYFDNVGGEILDACLVTLAMHARVVICGAISQYNNEQGTRGPSNYMMLLVKRSRMEGFLVSDYIAEYASAAREMAGWLREGKLRSHEEIVEGIDRFPETLLRLFTGEHVGKLAIEVTKPD
jgi:hypothetical protein